MSQREEIQALRDEIAKLREDVAALAVALATRPVFPYVPYYVPSQPVLSYITWTCGDTPAVIDTAGGQYS